MTQSYAMFVVVVVVRIAVSRINMYCSDTGVDAGPGSTRYSGGFNCHRGLVLFRAPWITLWLVVEVGLIVCCSIFV